jgi:hypothetical protein
MSLNIKKQPSILIKETFYETVDIKILNQLIDSELLREEKICEGGVYKNERNQLLAYKTKFTKNGIRVKYSITQSGYGRVNPVKSLSLCSFRREIRHTLAKDYYVDIDIVNCHPVILYQLCLKNKLFFSDSLKKYVEDRDNILKIVMDTYNVNKENAKNLFIRLLYFGSFEAWANDLVLQNKIPLKFIIDFKNDLSVISDYIIGANQEMVDELRKTKRRDLSNLRGTIVSYYLQEWERRILEIIYIYLRDNKIINNNNIVLCFDGVMIPKKCFDKNLLYELETEVLSKLGLNICLVEKEMDQDLFNKLNEEKEEIKIEKEERENEMNEYNYRTFDNEFFRKLNTYEGKKNYFEKFICKVITPEPCYIFSQEETDSNNKNHKQTYIWTKNNILDAFHQFKIEEDKQIDKNGNEKKSTFIQKWINDDCLKIYNRMDFLPSNYIQCSQSNEVSNNVYNLFHGYNPLILTQYNKNIRHEIIKIFKFLGKEICNGNEKYFDYFIKFIAHMIQKPNERIPIAFIIKGKQGSGKNVFLNAICNLLDKRNYITSSNPKDFFGDYAEGFYHKLLVNINECEGKDTFDFEGRLKSFISENTITLNAKFMRPITIQNYARLIVFSNKNTPIPIDIRSGDRRYVVFKTTEEFLDKRKYNDSFWSKLVTHFQKPEFIAALYDELNEMDIKDYEFIKNRPISEAYLDMCKQFIPPMALFFEHYIDTVQFQRDNKPSNIKPLVKENSIYYKKEIVEIGSELYQMYNEWSKRMGLNKEYETSIKKFYSIITDLELPIHKYKKDGIGSLKFIPETLYKFLIHKKWILINEDDQEEKLDFIDVKDNYDTFFDMI